MTVSFDVCGFLFFFVLIYLVPVLSSLGKQRRKDRHKLNQREKLKVAKNYRGTNIENP